MSSKGRHRDTQRSGRKKDPMGHSTLDPPSNCQISPPSTPEGPAPREHEHCRRELAEAKLLATNMEKTVRWWAECASKWKERWTRANAERHRAKKETRALKQQVVDLSQEVHDLREELATLKNGTRGEGEMRVKVPAEQAADTTLGALEEEVREVLKKLKNWRASGEQAAGGTQEQPVETSSEVLESEP
ncbi:coiled-coil domain-containing protein 102A-like [Ambystoma mexicanum]|uniref:coiled-coil domain-containing protein 102A-like n=1 Tax=Ambystoma mexicanum TaxID=8296 RepID=UPI0037E7C5FE